MVCPQCRAEYRQGVAVCYDCHVALVDKVPVAPGDPDEDPFCSFWKGDDPRIHAELCQILEDEGIPHRTVRRADHLFNIASQSPFEIGIPFSMFDKAETAIKEAYGGDDELQPASRLLAEGANDLPGTREGQPWRSLGRFNQGAGSDSQSELPGTELSDESSEPVNVTPRRAAWDPEDWYADEANVEVWAGEEPEMAEMLSASLNENRIHARIAEEAGRQRLFVLSEDESRARQILREIDEGQPRA